MGNKSRAETHKNEVPELKEKINQLALQLDNTVNVDELAKALHEAGRQAVLNNKVVKKDGAPIGQIKFIEWNELTADAKEGRKIQAEYLLKQYRIIKQ